MLLYRSVRVLSFLTLDSSKAAMPAIASPPTTVKAELVLLSIGFDHPSLHLAGRGFLDPRVKGRAGVEPPSLFARET